MAIQTQAQAFQIMTAKPKAPVAKKKQSASVISSKDITEQTEAFLKAGGRIERIERGVSGYQNLSRSWQPSLGDKPKN